MSDVKTTIVASPGDLKAFVDFPWKVYKRLPLWVPPLKKEVYGLLNTKKHPFWRFSEQILLLARRGSKVVGRIAGIVDHNFNAFHGEKCGVWGFFECMDDLDAAESLFSGVKAWVGSKGMTFLRGPFNPSTNYEAGLLVDGFEHPPAFMMTYNPAYYVRLITSCGFKKEKDLLSFFVEGDYQPPHGVKGVSEWIKKDMNAWARPLHPKEFISEASLIRKIYHDAWSENWGFVPTTEDEFRLIAKNVAKVLDEDLAFFLCYQEETVGVGLILPDINPLLKRLNGGLGLTGMLKILLHRNEINGARGFMFGIKKQFQEMGLPMVALEHLLSNMGKNSKYKYFEFGWNLEDNDSINQWLLEGGMKMRNRYRIFRLNF